MRRILRATALASLWLGAWLLLVESSQPAELAVGAGCSLVAAIASELAWGAHLANVTANLGALVQAWRLPWLMVTGTFEIYRVLFRHLFTRHKAESLMLAVDFDPGERDDPRDALRRALAIGYTTMAPNFVVIGIDQRKRRMLYHQMARSDVPVMTRKLGARP